MFSAVLILILLTEMIIFAVQVGVFEQRKSANEMNQKLAFHKADSAIQQAKQFMTANALNVSSAANAGGWLATGTTRWVECVGNEAKTHPCWAEPVAAFRDGDGNANRGSYFYSFNSSNELPLNPDLLNNARTGETATLHALLCMLEIDKSFTPPKIMGCTTDSALQDDRYFMVTLMARGEADCINRANCNAEAMVTEKIGSYGPGGGAGGPGVPLTARTNVPLKGTVEIVPNPNGGGVGVPISTWANARTDTCTVGGDPVTPGSGSYATCERHEWYGAAEFPADYKCPTNNGCACKKGDDKLLSYAQGNTRILGPDIVSDPNFPCDLWWYTFGVYKTNYLLVKEMVPLANQLTNCGSLDANSAGFYWISGSECRIQTQIGSADNPVFLISAVETTRVNAGGSIFGVLFVTDVEKPAAQFSGNGHATVYGAAIMDAVMKHFNGTFQIVYLEHVIDQAVDKGNFGAVAGGWTDFHPIWQ